MYCYSLKFNFLQCGNLISIPAGNYMFKVNNRNNRTRCEICSKLTMKIPERRQWLKPKILLSYFLEMKNYSWLVMS